MSTTNNAAKALSDFFAAAKSLDNAEATYNTAAEAAVRADVPLAIAAGDLKQREVAAQVGLSESAVMYHIAVLEACCLQNDMKPSELRTIMIAAHKTSGVSLSGLRKEVGQLPDTAKRSDAFRLVRKAIDAAVTAASKDKDKETKAPEAQHKTVARAATTLSNLKELREGTDLAATLAALALVEAEVKRLKSLVISALTVTVVEEVPATV